MNCIILVELTSIFFSFSLSYRELHAIFRSLHHLDGWQWDCQWSIMNLQGVYSGAFPTLVFHGKLGTFPTLSQQTWVTLPTHNIPTCLKFLIQESFRVSSWNQRVLIGPGYRWLQWNMNHSLRFETSTFSVTLVFDFFNLIMSKFFDRMHFTPAETKCWICFWSTYSKWVSYEDSYFYLLHELASRFLRQNKWRKYSTQNFFFFFCLKNI